MPLNNIAWCLRHFPMFLLPAGQYRLQPVHVDDLSALAVASAFEEANVVMDTAGPESYRFRDLVVLIREKLGVRCLILPPPVTGLRRGVDHRQVRQRHSPLTQPTPTRLALNR